MVVDLSSKKMITSSRPGLRSQAVKHDDFFTTEIDRHVKSPLLYLIEPDDLYVCC